MSTPLLAVEGLGVDFRRRRSTFSALNDITFDIRPGETLGLVGESGSGKTTIGRAILGLVKPSRGAITFEGKDITHASRTQRRALSRDIQVVFQDPYTSLNPSLTIEQILAEPLRAQGVGRTEASRRVRELLDRVKLPSDAAARLPREFSGGQRQRVAIARALALRPKLIVCDEPVSALDLSTQQRVLDLFIEIQRQNDCAYLFVSHDLSVVRHVSHRVLVLNQGALVESGDVDKITSDPDQPYTRRLMMSAPVPDPAAQRERRAQLELVRAADATE
jgi:ABC-type glutathione transport system ATPase component